MNINGVSKIDKRYLKEITFTHDDKEYSVNLYWDSDEGFDVTFIDHKYNQIPMPDWAVNWEDTEEESLAFTLDELTDIVLEGDGNE